MDIKYFDTIFAVNGDQTVIPDAVQSNGTISYAQGYGPNYARNQLTDPLALPIDRATMNYLFMTITAALQQYQQHSLPEWISPANNNGAAFPYSKHAMVRYSATVPGTTYETYVSTVDNNTSVPGADTNWQLSNDIVATAAQATAGTDNRNSITSLTLAQQTALRALIAGNATQVFNVGPATSATQAPQLSQIQTLSSVRGLIGGVNATTPATKLDINCNRAVLRKSSGGFPSLGQTIVFDLPGPITNDITLAGPVINGRDQAGAFSAGANVHFYYISDGVNFQTISSLNAPNLTAGPNMPSGYTYWAYVTSLVLNGSAQFTNVFLRGAWVHYTGLATVVNGGSTSLTSVNISGFVPAIAECWELTCSNLAVSSGSGSYTLSCNVVVSGTAVNASFGLQGYGPSSAIIAGTAGFSKVMPNVNLNFAYQLIVAAGSGPVVSFNVGGYTVPNGDC